VPLVSAGPTAVAISPNAITSATLRAWYRADTIAQADATAVAQWNDTSGNARHLTATGTAQPTYKTAIVNGQPIVRFNGTTNWMRYATGFTLQDFHFFMLAKITTQQMIFERPGLTYFFDTGATVRVGGADAGSLGGGWNNTRTGFDLLEVRFTTGSVTIWRNGYELYWQTANVLSAEDAGAALDVGARSGPSLTTTGDFAELIFYDGTVRPGEIAGLYAYMVARYALTALT
jgi:hypothetical protein